MKAWTMAGILMLLAASCGDDGEPGDGDTITDAGPDCSEPALGCACPTVGETICTTGEPGPDLLCTEDGWVWSADGPCPGLDGGPGRDFGP